MSWRQASLASAGLIPWSCWATSTTWRHLLSLILGSTRWTRCWTIRTTPGTTTVAILWTWTEANRIWWLCTAHILMTVWVAMLWWILRVWCQPSISTTTNSNNNIIPPPTHHHPYLPWVINNNNILLQLIRAIQITQPTWIYSPPHHHPYHPTHIQVKLELWLNNNSSNNNTTNYTSSPPIPTTNRKH